MNPCFEGSKRKSETSQPLGKETWGERPKIVEKEGVFEGGFSGF